jgi:hypothetical protein
MLFNILTGAGLSNNVLKSGDRQAAFRQTPAEHEELLDERNLPGYSEAMMLEGPARLMAIQQLRAQAALREAESPKYWLDEYPRRNISQSSSFIGDINYDPYSNAAQIQIGNKVYSYSRTPDQIAEMINSPSLGGYFNRVLKG